MKKGGTGGANTQSGLIFEGKTDLSTFLSRQKGYKIKGDGVYFKGKLKARIFRKYSLYKVFLNELGIDWKKYISKRLLPDNSIYVLIKNTLNIIECKHQHTNGSVDEKIQTCDFKKKEYQKLFSPANIDVEYIYILDDWFRQDKYKDMLDYIISANCHYYFQFIPLYKLGLPKPLK